jgi:antirestriction protein ArdC
MEATATVFRSTPYRKSNSEQERAEALTRAVSVLTTSNYLAICQGFIAKGTPESETHPRENVFTFDTWKALGRYVRWGERGVKVVTFIECSKKAGTGTEAGEEKTFHRPWTTTVFHFSQTEQLSRGVK